MERGPRGWGQPSGQIDLLLAVGLDDVALAEVAEAVEHDTALHAGPDLANVVADAPQGRDLALPEHPLAALHARRVAAQDLAVRDETPGRRAALADREQLPDLGVAVHDL